MRVAVIGTGPHRRLDRARARRARARRRRLRPRRDAAGAGRRSSARSARSRRRSTTRSRAPTSCSSRCRSARSPTPWSPLLDAGVPLVTDVGSVKAPVVAEVETRAARTRRRGSSAATRWPVPSRRASTAPRADLFVGAAWVLTPTRRHRRARVRHAVLRVIRDLGADVVTRHARATTTCSWRS